MVSVHQITDTSFHFPFLNKFDNSHNWIPGYNMIRFQHVSRSDSCRRNMADFFEFCNSHPEHETHAMKRHASNRELVPVTYKILPSEENAQKLALINFFNLFL